MFPLEDLVPSLFVLLCASTARSVRQRFVKNVPPHRDLCYRIVKMNSGIYEDSDQDSLYEESPTDGYFSQRDIPQEIYTESPSSTSQSKAQEAAEESQQSQPSSAARTEPTQFRRPPSHSPTWVNEATPLLDDGPPPPTYSDATSTRPYGANSSAISRSDSWPEAQGSETDSQRSRDRFPVNYGTASTTPLLFLGNGLPQSMGGSGDEERGRDIAARQYRRKIRDCCSMKRLLELLLVSGVIAGVVLIMKLSGGSRDVSACFILPILFGLRFVRCSMAYLVSAT